MAVSSIWGAMVRKPFFLNSTPLLGQPILHGDILLLLPLSDHAVFVDVSLGPAGHAAVAALMCSVLS